MALVIAKQGDVKRGLDIWDQSLRLHERTGDVRGKAAALTNMAWAAHQQGDRERVQKLYVRAAKALASVQAWPDLVTVLCNLGATDSPESLRFLSQALWLAMRIQSPLESTLSLTGAFVSKIGPGHDASPLASACWVRQAEARGKEHPKFEELRQYGVNVLGACAEARGIKPDTFNDWIESEGLHDPSQFLPKLQQELEAMVGKDNWLFDRAEFANA